ncbi:MAG: GNAT family N-acetyltransferase, partial [Polaromonas sp.]
MPLLDVHASAPTDAKAPRLTALRANHLPYAAALSLALAWPYREADWRFAFELGSGIAAEVDGRLVGTALWWPYGETHASLGMVIVAAEMQGRGLGRALMGALLNEAGDRTLILNSTQEGLRLYTQLGFVPVGQVFQHQAVLPADPLLATKAIGIRPMQAGDDEAVRRLDLTATGMDRTPLLDALFKAGPVIVADHGTGVQGYACVREFGRGIVIGPVIAHNAADATALIATLASRHRGGFVRVDVTEDSGLSPWLTSIGLPRVGHVESMVRGACPSVAA